jgi:alkylated DNA repair dioxygenase AlkB
MAYAAAMAAATAEATTVLAGYQSSLFDQAEGLAGAPVLGPLRPRRTVLTSGAWIDTCPGWLHGSDALFERLVRDVPWRAERRQMYERVVDVPRLLAFYAEGDRLPHPVLDQLKAALDEHYGPELGEPFTTAGLCLYRDGRDSVAWHGDRIGRSSTEDTMVAIVSIGSPRTLMLRPKPGLGDSSGTLRHELGHGDLLVMGGSCQRTWEHAIPKTVRPVGPRISIQFRPYDVR